MNKFKSKWNWKKPAPHPQGGISKTIPSQALSIKEIIKRQSQGILNNNVKTPQYHDDTDLENLRGIDVRKLDLVEIHEEMNNLASSLEQKHNDIQKQKSEKQKLDQFNKEQQLKKQWEAEYLQKQQQKLV